MTLQQAQLLHDKQPTLLPRCEVMSVLFDP